MAQGGKLWKRLGEVAKPYLRPPPGPGGGLVQLLCFLQFAREAGV